MLAHLGSTWLLERASRPDLRIQARQRIHDQLLALRVDVDVGVGVLLAGICGRFGSLGDAA